MVDREGENSQLIWKTTVLVSMIEATHAVSTLKNQPYHVK